MGSIARICFAVRRGSPWCLAATILVVAFVWATFLFLDERAALIEENMALANARADFKRAAPALRQLAQQIPEAAGRQRLLDLIDGFTRLL